MLPELSDLLAYENEKVVANFCRQYPAIEITTAKQIFKDLLAWLWISAYRETQGKITQVITPLVHLDNMWHVFILHTREYIIFCNQYFSRYLHHEVEVQEQENMDFSVNDFRELLSHCYDYLGDGWLKRNFALE